MDGESILEPGPELSNQVICLLYHFQSSSPGPLSGAWQQPHLLPSPYFNQPPVSLPITNSNHIAGSYVLFGLTLLQPSSQAKTNNLIYKEECVGDEEKRPEAEYGI